VVLFVRFVEFSPEPNHHILVCGGKIRVLTWVYDEGKAEEGRTDAEKGRTDAEESRTDAEEGRTDAEEGRTDATPTEQKEEDICALCCSPYHFQCRIGMGSNGMLLQRSRQV
jgi:hypothetical protein